MQNRTKQHLILDTAPSVHTLLLVPTSHILPLVNASKYAECDYRYVVTYWRTSTVFHQLQIIMARSGNRIEVVWHWQTTWMAGLQLQLGGGTATHRTGGHVSWRLFNSNNFATSEAYVLQWVLFQFVFLCQIPFLSPSQQSGALTFNSLNTHSISIERCTVVAV